MISCPYAFALGLELRLLTIPILRQLAQGVPYRDSDLEACSHRHDILALAVEAGEEHHVPMTLYHWSPPAIHITAIPTLSRHLLSLVKGFTPLGTFFVGNGVDMSETLSRLLTERGGNPELTAQTLTDLIAELDVPTEGTLFEFFSFSVLSNNPSRVFDDGLFPVWKWVKPESVYQKMGGWEADVAQALDHGEWNGGKELVLLAAGVTEETLQTIMDRKRKFTCLERLLAL